MSEKNFLLLKNVEYPKICLKKTRATTEFEPATCGLLNRGATPHMYYMQAANDSTHHGQNQEKKKNHTLN